MSAIAGRRTSAVLVITALLLGSVLPLAGLGQEAAPAEKPTVKPRPVPGNVAKGLCGRRNWNSRTFRSRTPWTASLPATASRSSFARGRWPRGTLPPDEPITERIHSMKLDKALDTFFQHLHLAYAVCDNAIVVTTATQAEVQLVTRVYPLSMPRGGGLRP